MKNLPGNGYQITIVLVTVRVEIGYEFVKNRGKFLKGKMRWLLGGLIEGRHWFYH
jgi:hypothetical protein